MSGLTLEALRRLVTQPVVDVPVVAASPPSTPRGPSPADIPPPVLDPLSGPWPGVKMAPPLHAGAKPTWHRLLDIVSRYMTFDAGRAKLVAKGTPHSHERWCLLLEDEAGELCQRTVGKAVVVALTNQPITAGDTFTIQRTGVGIETRYHVVRDCP